MEKRLFIGIKIEPSPRLLDVYQELKADLNEEAIKWIANENMHITLMFLGNTNIKYIPQIKEGILKTILNFKSFHLEIKGIGFFKYNNQIKVIWMGINKKEELDCLANQLIYNLKEYGFENKEKQFNAHLTLGRVNSIISHANIQTLTDRYKELAIQNVKAEDVTLFESIKTPNGTNYLPLENYPIKTEF